MRKTKMKPKVKYAEPVGQEYLSMALYKTQQLTARTYGIKVPRPSFVSKRYPGLIIIEDNRNILDKFKDWFRGYET